MYLLLGFCVAPGGIWKTPGLATVSYTSFNRLSANSLTGCQGDGGEAEG